MRLSLNALFVFVLVGCANDPPYQNCSRTVLCTGDTSLCLSTTASSGRTALFCTTHCTIPIGTASAECPANSACVRVNGGDAVCLQRCTADTECPFTNGACLVTADSLGARVCSVRP
jgi:hypothetical protein